jgi:hypothetical protein
MTYALEHNFSEPFKKLGYVENIVFVHKSFFIIRHPRVPDVFLIRNANARNPFEPGITFTSTAEAIYAIDGVGPVAEKFRAKKLSKLLEPITWPLQWSIAARQRHVVARRDAVTQVLPFLVGEERAAALNWLDTEKHEGLWE